jgi:hypothetical protein
MAVRKRGRGSWGRRLGVLTALSLGACGRAGDDSRAPLELGTGPRPPEASRAAPSEVDPVSVPEASVPEGAAAEGLPPGFPGAALPEDSRRTQIDAMLERECSACHDGPSAERDRFLDVEMLLDNGYLRRGAGETSGLALWLQYGDARREHAGVRVSAEELGVLFDYVNSMPAPKTCQGYDIVDRDRAQELMSLDLARRAPADRPFIRYVGALQATQPTGCTGGPPGQGAFVQLVNAISLSPQVVAVGEPIEGGPIYALDLRDYGWTAPIDVDGSGHFEDRWSAIVAAAGPYALELQGPEADALKQQTGVPVPFLSATVFVAHASVGALYSALVGVGSDVSALATALAVDDLSVPERAGFFGAGALPDRVVTRREQGAGLSWWTREELQAPAAIDAGLARDPVHYSSRGAEVIFTLPNGLSAFAISGADGRRLDELPCTSDLPCAGPIRALNSVTCRGCHGNDPTGLLDEVLPYLDADPTRYAPDLVPLIRQQYRADLWQALEADQTLAHTALEAATVGFGSRGSITDTYYDFADRPLDAIRAADDLGVQVEQVRAAITTLGDTAAELAPLLSDGTIERRLFTSHFQELACAIGAPRNMPSRCP